jgi:hypothetical protein
VLKGPKIVISMLTSPFGFQNGGQCSKTAQGELLCGVFFAPPEQQLNLSIFAAAALVVSAESGEVKNACGHER